MIDWPVNQDSGNVMVKKIRQTAPRLAMSIGSVIVALALAEAFLSLRHEPPIHAWPMWRYQGDHLGETNQLGYRGRSIHYDENDYVVLLIGDSQVQAEACGFDRLPEKRLEEHLMNLVERPVRVFSVGAAGYGQDQQLLALKEFFAKYSANLVVHWETASNDVWNNMFPTHWPKDGVPKPTFWLDRHGALKGPVAHYSAFRLLTVIRHQVFRFSLDEFWERKYLPPRFQPQSSHSGEVISDWGRYHSHEEDVESGKTHVGLQVVPTTQRIRYGVELTRHLLNEMRELSRENDAGFAAFSVERPDMPLPDGVYALDRGDKAVYVELSQQQYAKNLEALNGGVPFFEIEVEVRPFAHDSDPHLNANAVDQVMESLAATLVRQGVLGQVDQALTR